MASSSGCELDSEQIHVQLHVDSDSFSEFSQDSVIDIFDRIDSDGVGGCSGGYSDEDHDNEDWFSGTKVTMISIRYHLVPHLVINHLEADKCLFLQTNLCPYFNANLFQEIASETKRYMSIETLYNMNR
jgi:hypothetical protein